MANQVIGYSIILRNLTTKGSVSSTDIIGISDANGNLLFKTTIQQLVQNSGVTFSGNIAGLANTDTIPASGATPESQVIYLAGPGTYTNFPDGTDPAEPIVLTENLNVVSWDGTKATVQPVPVNVDLSGKTDTGGSTKTTQDLDDDKLDKSSVIDNVTTNSSSDAVSAKQAKIINDKLGQVTTQRVSSNLLLDDYKRTDVFWNANSLSLLPANQDPNTNKRICYVIPVNKMLSYVCNGFSGSFPGAGYLKSDLTGIKAYLSNVIGGTGRLFDPNDTPDETSAIVVNAYADGRDSETLIFAQTNQIPAYEPPGVVVKIPTSAIEGDIVTEDTVDTVVENKVVEQTPAIIKQNVSYSGVLDGLNGYIPRIYGNPILDEFAMRLANMTQDETTVIVATSLAARNLYAPGLLKPYKMPPMTQADTWTSKLCRDLMPVGQTYSGYDDPGVFTETGEWDTVFEDGNWDECFWNPDKNKYESHREALTRISSSANASISYKIGTGIWRGDFVYRTDSTGDILTFGVNLGTAKAQCFDEATQTWVELNGYQLDTKESAATANKGNTTYQKRLKIRFANWGGSAYTLDSRSSEKTITVTKSGDISKRMMYWGLEMSVKPFIFRFINAARGGHAYFTDETNPLSLLRYIDNDVHGHKPTLILAGTTLTNMAYSTVMTLAGLGYDREGMYQIVKRWTIDGTEPNSFRSRTNNFTTAKLVLYSETCASGNGIFQNGELTITTRSWIPGNDNGLPFSLFDYFDYLEQKLIADQSSAGDFCFIPLWSQYKYLAVKQFGSFYLSSRPSGIDGLGSGEIVPLTGLPKHGPIGGTIPTWQFDETHQNVLGMEVIAFIFRYAFRVNFAVAQLN